MKMKKPPVGAGGNGETCSTQILTLISVARFSLKVKEEIENGA